MEKEAHIVVRIEPELREKLKKLAEQEDRSVSWLIRKAIEKYLCEAMCK
jgi:predicted transcriptional regulator